MQDNEFLTRRQHDVDDVLIGRMVTEQSKLGLQYRVYNKDGFAM